jgi:hypothetical protein
MLSFNIYVLPVLSTVWCNYDHEIRQSVLVHWVTLSSFIKQLWIINNIDLMGVPQVKHCTNETYHNICRCQLSSSSKRQMCLVTILSGIRPFMYIKSCLRDQPIEVACCVQDCIQDGTKFKVLWVGESFSEARLHSQVLCLSYPLYSTLV